MRRPGTYILTIALGSDTELEVGALGTLLFSAGEYCYVGSAMGGVGDVAKIDEAMSQVSRLVSEMLK